MNYKPADIARHDRATNSCRQDIPPINEWGAPLIEIRYLHIEEGVSDFRSPEGSIGIRKSDPTRVQTQSPLPRIQPRNHRGFPKVV